MLKVNTYSAKGTKLGLINLPKAWEAKENLNLLAQAIRVYEDRAHVGLVKTKTRAEVNRTKKKWYKQKGTGGARHGAKSAPIFVGGGVAHGPRAVKRELSLSKAMTKKALSVAISLKVKKGEVAVVDGLGKFTKTKEVGKLLAKIAAKRATFITADAVPSSTKVFKNIKGIKLVPYKDLNPYRVLFGGILIFDKAIFTKK